MTFAPNQYIENLTGSALLSLPVPRAEELKELTAQAGVNNGFDFELSERDRRTIAALRQNIRHVIYVIKENRTYDQILGDLWRGNGAAMATPT